MTLGGVSVDNFSLSINTDESNTSNFGFIRFFHNKFFGHMTIYIALFPNQHHL